MLYPLFFGNNLFAQTAFITRTRIARGNPRDWDFPFSSAIADKEGQPFTIAIPLVQDPKVGQTSAGDFFANLVRCFVTPWHVPLLRERHNLLRHVRSVDLVGVGIRTAVVRVRVLHDRDVVRTLHVANEGDMRQVQQAL